MSSLSDESARKWQWRVGVLLVRADYSGNIDGFCLVLANVGHVGAGLVGVVRSV